MWGLAFMKLVDVLVRLAKKEHSRRRKILGIIIGAIVFIIIVPASIIYVALIIDNMYSLKPIHESLLYFKLCNIVLGAILTFLGLFFAGWAAYTQWRYGKGSPLPTAPTQKLVTTGPYAYCRNPMMLGTILYYLGLVLLVGSPTGVVLVILFEILYGVYIKFVEEKELELRFGKEYIEYRKYTPFIIPRPRRGKASCYHNNPAYGNPLDQEEDNSKNNKH